MFLTPDDRYHGRIFNQQNNTFHRPGSLSRILLIQSVSTVSKVPKVYSNRLGSTDWDSLLLPLENFSRLSDKEITGVSRDYLPVFSIQSLSIALEVPNKNILKSFHQNLLWGLAQRILLNTSQKVKISCYFLIFGQLNFGRTKLLKNVIGFNTKKCHYRILLNYTCWN